MKNIALIGFMGTGKSATGRLIAADLKMKFIDMDSTIENREQRRISEIFEKDGEPYFRNLERNLITELSANSGLVISCGGGIVLNPDNISDLEKSGLVACLSATPETILERVKNDTNRPLLAVADKLGKIRELLAKRQHLYDAIPCQVKTDSKTIRQVADEIISAYKKGL